MSGTRIPSLVELLTAAIDGRLGGVHTALPGRIESYDASTQKATVKPLIQNVELPAEGAEIVDVLPVLHDVPVIFPRTAGFFLSLAVAPGDLVLLVFLERSADLWLHSQGGDTHPVDPRRHDLSDAVALPGLFPFPRALKHSNTSGVKLGSDAANGLCLELTAAGELKVTLGAQPVLTLAQGGAAAMLTLGTGAVSPAIAENFQVLWTLLTVYLTAMAASITALGGSPPTPPPPWDPTIASMKVKVPL
jgi:hypothetical protein